jgi:hypothetical protein
MYSVSPGKLWFDSLLKGRRRDDYLQIYSNGDIYMFGNIGKMGQWKDRGK